MSENRVGHSYEDIISIENLLEAWREFLRGKRSRGDVQVFERNLMSNVLSLHEDLVNRTYTHSAYHAFKISDPKPRDIHKASVRDRLLHHAIYRVLYPFFDEQFIHDSYSCRKGKGTHRALKQFRAFAYKASENHTKTVWILKCDIRKFFASIDHARLKAIVRREIQDDDICWLLSRVIGSFSSREVGVGLPLGNLTSQLLVNIYMNEFDQFVKNRLKIQHYVRYADDFVILSQDRRYLKILISEFENFLRDVLRLEMHPNKVSITTMTSGVDFLGWVHFPDHQVLRTVAKRRMFRNMKEKAWQKPTIDSYLGLLRHGNARKLQKEMQDTATLEDLC